MMILFNKLMKINVNIGPLFVINKTNMNKSLLILGVVLCFSTILHATVVPHVGPIHSHVPRTYKLSLDDTPEQRWSQMVKDYKEPLAKFME